MYKKTHIVFFSISCNFSFLPNECPGLCRHRTGHTLDKNIKLHKMKNEKNYMVFLLVYIKYRKFWSISLELFIEHKLRNWEGCHQNPNKLKMSLLTSQVYNRVMNRSGCHRRIPFNSLPWWRGLEITLKEMKNIENIKQSQFNFMLIMSRKNDWQEFVLVFSKQ